MQVLDTAWGGGGVSGGRIEEGREEGRGEVVGFGLERGRGRGREEREKVQWRGSAG